MEKKYEVVESYGILGEKKMKEGSQTLELKLVKWFGGQARLDLRWWTGDMPGKGCIFGAAEAVKLRKVLDEMELE